MQPPYTEPLRGWDGNPSLRPGRGVVGYRPLSGLGSRSAAEMVAAVDALHRSVEMSDERCDGVADDVEINEAIGRLPT